MLCWATFSPSFQSVVVHLSLHLSYEIFLARLCTIDWICYYLNSFLYSSSWSVAWMCTLSRTSPPPPTVASAFFLDSFDVTCSGLSWTFLTSCDARGPTHHHFEIVWASWGMSDSSFFPLLLSGRGAFWVWAVCFSNRPCHRRIDQTVRLLWTCWPVERRYNSFLHWSKRSTRWSFVDFRSWTLHAWDVGRWDHAASCWPHISVSNEGTASCCTLDLG